MATVFALTCAWSVWYCAPGPLWYDTAEFGATSWRLSLSHPPGHPLHALATHGVQQLVPLGDLGFRANLTSALCLGLALALFFRLLCRLAPQGPRFAAAAFALVPLALSPIAEQGIRAEVYALQILLSVWLCLLCLRVAEGNDARALPSLALLFGLAGANHSYIAVGFVPLALMAMWHARVSIRQVLAAVAAGILGLSTYLYLPLRASAGLDVGWGQPDTLTAFWRTISGQDWSANLIPDSNAESIFENLGLVLGYIKHHLGLGFIIAAVLIVAWGLRAWIKERRWRVMAIFFVAALPFALRLGNSFDPQNPDMGGYLATGFLAIIALVFCATSRLSRTALVAATAIFVTLPAIQTIQKVKDDVSNDRGAEQYAVQLLDSVPPDGVLIAGDYSTIFTAWWLRSIMGSRPDVGLLFRGQINRAWHRRRAASARVGLGPRLKHYPKSFITPDVRWELGVKLDELGPLRTRLKPLGLTASVTRQAITVRTQSQAFKVFQGTSFAGKRFAALLHVHFLTQLMVSGATAQVLKWHLQELTTLAGSDPLVGTLRARLNDYLRDGRATGP